MSTAKLALIHLGIFMLLVALLIISHGTGGGGDSITHFFFAEMAWEKPEYLFNLWAKPFFTLLASPFAQWGFKGMEVFNILNGTLASFVTALVARKLNKSWYWAIPILAFIAPAYYTYLFSGLTEPLAALMIILAVWLCLKNRLTAGFIIASFLPFIRGEAQIFLVFFAFFGILNGAFKKTPWLLTGYLIFALAGWSHHDSPWWIFNQPYDSGTSVYGKGAWNHYLVRLFGMIGWPFMILAGLGFVQLAINLQRGRTFLKRELILVHGLFLSLLIAHSMVWALGIYGSAGLERTLLPVFPLLWLIMLDGVQLLRQLSQKYLLRKAFLLPLMILGIQIWHMAQPGLAGYYYQAHLNETDNNRFFREQVTPYLKTRFPDAGHYVTDDPFIAFALGVNFKDSRWVSSWTSYRYFDELPSRSVMIFDRAYVPVHTGITEDILDADERLVKHKSWQTSEQQRYVVYIPRSYPQ